MKNKLVARVLGNDVVSRIVGNVSRFYISHESTILTCGTIGFSMTCTWVTYKNAPKINEILLDARTALLQCNTKEEKNQVYKLVLKELFPLVAPILIFQGATIGCAIFSKKQSDKKLAEAAGALSIAQAAIAQYQSFQNEAAKALGEEKYVALQNDIFEKHDIDGRRFTALASEGAPGEQLFIDKYSGRPFWSSYERIRFATERLNMKLTSSGGYDQVSINDWYDEIENPDLTINELGERFGYIADPDFAASGISTKFADTHFIFPNGTRVQAAEVYLYPEPGCIDWGC